MASPWTNAEPPVMKVLHFGYNWPFPPELPRAPAMLCFWCKEPITATESGAIQGYVGETVMCIAYHRECMLRQLLGSVGHQQEQCSCFGGETEDPEGMTTRQAAQAAVEHYIRQQRRGP